MNSQLLLIFASFIGGLTYVLNKKITKSNFDSATYTALMAFCYTVFALPLLLIQFHVSLSPYYWFLVLVSITFYGFSVFFSFKAYKTTDASVVSIIHKLSLVFTALIGIFILGELYSANKYFGLILVFLSSVVLIYDGKKIVLKTGMIFALLMAITSALAGVLDKQILKDFSPFTYAFLNNFLIWVLFSFKSSLKKQKQLFIFSPKPIILSALINIVSWTIFLVVLQKTNVSQTFPVYKCLSLISPVFLGILFLKEKNQLWQKIAGTILGIIGIFFLYI